MICAGDDKFDTTVDSDRDGVADHIEVMYGFDPQKPYDVWRDLDQDHLPKLFEVMAHKDHQVKDNDVFSQLQLLGISAIADLHSRLPSDEELEQALIYNKTPIDLYYNLLDAQKLSKMAIIGQAYQTLLSRAPDRDGARYYYHQLNGKMTEIQMIAQMLGSKEYDKHHIALSDGDFIQWLVRDLSIFQANKTAQQYQQHLTSNELTREQLIVSHIKNLAKANPQQEKEQNRVFNATAAVKVLSLLITDTLPNKQQLDYFIKAVEQHDIEVVIQQLLLSDEFRHNRLQDALPSQGDIDNDGRPNGVEFILGFDPHTKDNQVLDKDEDFIRQVFLDGFSQVLTRSQLKGQLLALQQHGSKATWLTGLAQSHVAKDNQTQWLYQTLLTSNQQGTIEHNNSASLTTTIDQILQSSQFEARFY